MYGRASTSSDIEWQPTHLSIIEAVLNLLAVHVNTVVVILGVHDEAAPFPPAGRYVRPVVLVQILAKVAGAVADIGQVRGERLGLVRRLPARTGAVVVVREHLVVVHVHAGQQAGPGRAAHGRRGVRVPKFGAALLQQPQRARHKVE